MDETFCSMKRFVSRVILWRKRFVGKRVVAENVLCQEIFFGTKYLYFRCKHLQFNYLYDILKHF